MGQVDRPMWVSQKYTKRTVYRLMRSVYRLLCNRIETYLISISLPRISSTAFPIAVICSSFLPAKLQPNQRSEFSDDKRTWKNAGSIRIFFERSNTDIPSIFTWLRGLLRNALDIVFIVFVASSKCIIQLHIFKVFSIL